MFVVNVAVLCAALCCLQVSSAMTLYSQLAFHNQGITRSCDNFVTRRQCSAFGENVGQFSEGQFYNYTYIQSNDDGTFLAPALGIRSAVPLGGLGTGTLELRGDGRVKDYLIENQGPGLSRTGKVDRDDIMIAVHVSRVNDENENSSVSVALRTHDLDVLCGASFSHTRCNEDTSTVGDAGQRVAGVDALEYSGSFPVSKYGIRDKRIDALGVRMTLFAHSPFRMWDSEQSSIPAIAFSVDVENPTDDAMTVGQMFVLPAMVERDTARSTTAASHSSQIPDVHSPEGCARACHDLDSSECAAWQWDPSDDPWILNDDDLEGCDLAPGGLKLPTQSPQECAVACKEHPLCAAASYVWGGNCFLKNAVCPRTYRGSGVVSFVMRRRGCTLFADAMPERRQLGSFSGVRGTWRQHRDHSNNDDRDGNLILEAVRPGQSPASGSLALMAASTSGDTSEWTTAASTASNPSQLFQKFASRSTVSRTAAEFLDRQVVGNDTTGALAIGARLGPRSNVTMTILLGWSFPNRSHADRDVGNHYANRFPTGKAAAAAMASTLPQVVADAAQWHEVASAHSSLTNSDGNGDSGSATQQNVLYPDWLIDFFVNSPAALTKTSLWTRDGRFRQYESFSCDELDPVHIHLYRAIPYALLFPNLSKNLLSTGYAQAQASDGWIPENLGAGCSKPIGIMDTGGGRSMGDTTAGYIIDALNLYRHTGDQRWVQQLWPTIRAAALWQVNRSSEHGLPTYLDSTYDWFSFNAREVVSYNAMMHATSMRAAAKLAIACNDTQTRDVADAAATRASNAIEGMLYNGKHYQPWWQDGAATPYGAMHADCLAGQVWATLLGLGWVIEPGRVASHLQQEQVTSGTEWGLCVLFLPDQHVPKRDDLIWEAGSLDWTTLMLQLGYTVEESLPEAEKVIRKYRSQLNDLWDWRDLTAGPDIECDVMGEGATMEGQPFCNSHYGRQLIGWATVLGLSGQQWDAVTSTLSFRPARSTTRVSNMAPKTLPFITPFCAGRLILHDSTNESDNANHSRKDTDAELVVVAGSLDAKVIKLGEWVVAVDVHAKAGEVIDLHPR